MRNNPIKKLQYLLSLAVCGMYLLSCGPPSPSLEGPSAPQATSQGPGRENPPPPPDQTNSQPVNKTPGKKTAPPQIVQPPVVQPPVAQPAIVQPTRISETIGIYRFDIDLRGPRPVIRYAKNNAIMSRQQFIEELASVPAFDFRSIVNNSIAKLPAPNPQNGYMLQAPVIRNTNLNSKFYFVAIRSTLYPPNGDARFNQYLSHCNPAPPGANRGGEYGVRFIDFYAFDAGLTLQRRTLHDPLANLPFGALFFKGIGAVRVDPEEIMVVPCPVDANIIAPGNHDLGHIYTFAKAFTNEAILANKQRLQSFWYAVGNAANRMLNNGAIQDMDGNPKADLYLSTHGSGVYYLHFRVENHQRYYGQVPALIGDVPSVHFYNAAFQ